MKKALIALLCIFTLAAFSSCSNDVDPPAEAVTYTLVYEQGYVVKASESGQMFTAILAGSDGSEQQVEFEIPTEAGVHTFEYEFNGVTYTLDVLVLDSEENVIDTEGELRAAVAAESTADYVYVAADITLTNTLTIAKEGLEIDFGGHILSAELTGTVNMIGISAADVVIRNAALEYKPTGNVTVSFINATASGFQIIDTSFTGNYTMVSSPESGNDNTLRGVTAGSGTGSSAWLISGCTFTDVRQPMYVETAGRVENSTISGTRGWVVCDNADVTFKGNKFEGDNAEDFAIIDDGNSADDGIWTEDKCLSLSADNSNARVQQQVKGFRVIDGEIYADIDDAASLRAFFAADSVFDQGMIMKDIEVTDGVLVYANDSSSLYAADPDIVLSLNYASDSIYGQSLIRVIASDVAMEGFTVRYANDAQSTLNILKVSDQGTKDEVTNVSLTDMRFVTDTDEGTAKIAGLNFHGTGNCLIQNVEVTNSLKVNVSVANSSRLVIDNPVFGTAAWGGNVGIMYSDNGSYDSSEVEFRNITDSISVYAEGVNAGHEVTGLGDGTTAEDTIVWRIGSAE